MNTSDTYELKVFSSLVGKDRSTASKWCARGMPHERRGRKVFVELAPAVAWLKGNDLLHPEWQPADSTAATPTARQSTPPREPTEYEAGLHARLTDPKASPVEKARAAHDLAAFRLAEALRDGQLGAKTFDDLKHAGEELRRAEQDYIELAKARAELIERAIAKEVIGEMARALVDLHGNFETDVARQVGAWVEDPAFLAAGTEARLRIARNWLREHSESIRKAWADEIDRKAQEASQ